MALLELNDVHTYYGAVHALDGVGLTVHEGEIVTLIGANGAGKSTTLKTISGLQPPSRGTLTFSDHALAGLPAHEITRLGVGHVPEGRRIFPRMTVMENLEMGAYTVADVAQTNATIETVFELFPRLKERSRQLGGTLSGGEQQMLAIGRALMMQPRILLLDEPSMGLAPVLVEQIFMIIQTLNDRGVTILLVEQNAHLALQVAARGYVIQTGTIVLTDTAENLQRNEMVRQAYLGELD